MPRDKIKMKRWPIRCEICGKERMVSKSWAKYCGDRCKAIGWAVRQKQEMVNDHGEQE